MNCFICSMVHNLSNSSGLLQVFLGELRDKEIQKDRERFRRNLERLGQIMAYEISKTLPAKEVIVESPLATATISVPAVEPVLCCVLRAGLPFFNGFQDYFSNSDCAFIGAYRGENKDDLSFDIELEYTAIPEIEGRHIFLIDPMLATGKSIVKAAEAFFRRGKPSSITIASVIASPDGLDWVEKNLPDSDIWVAAIDKELNSHAYIVPGLGDAGDLAFGPKTA